MSFNKKLLLGLLLLVIATGVFVYFNKFNRPKTKVLPQPTPTGQPSIANPASVYCIDQGGKLEIRKDGQGNEAGFCIFPDGSECEEWAYFRSECSPSTTPKENFCGSSTYGKCISNSDCKTGGCSGQICQSTKEAGAITTCEWKDCYDHSKYELECQCVNKQCQWGK